MALELRGPHGEVVPTEDIAVRDTEFLIAWSEGAAQHDAAALADDEAAAISPLDDQDDVLPWESSEDDFDEDALIAELEALAADDMADGWRQREERPWMRYQLQVELMDDSSIP